MICSTDVILNTTRGHHQGYKI